MKEMKQDRIALDRASARSFDELSGHMHVAQTNISKAAVNPYNGREIPSYKELGLDSDKVYMLLRDPEELAKAASTFHNKPLVMVHRAQNVGDQDHTNRVGVASSPVYDPPFLKADLAVWTKEAIDAIRSDEQRELSCGYGYKPDMTPGTYEGQRYDGVMREINGNHVALVKEGRAGADCHVFDSTENLIMTKKAVLSRTGAFESALSVFLKPHLAMDAKVDLGPAVKDITSKNLKDKKATLAADIKKRIEGKLAQDADISPEELIEAVEVLAPLLGEDPGPTAVDPLNPAEDDDDSQLRAMLKAKGHSEEDIEKICSGKMGAADETEEEKKKREEAERVAAARDAGSKDLISKTAMDQAIAEVRKQAVAEGAAAAVRAQREIFGAIEVVRPWVGTFHQGMSFDSAPDVYRAALKTLGKDVKNLHPDALKPILEAQPKPGERSKTTSQAFAMDEAAAEGFSTRYPKASHIRLL